MRVVIQRVLNANVKVDGNIIGSCNEGYLLLVGFTEGDNKEIVDMMADKIVNLRINEDEQGKTNLSILTTKGEILSISQFTLYANCKEGRRPSFVEALKPNLASELYDYFNEKLRSYDIKVGVGEFGADMKVELINNGPFTIVLDSLDLIKKK